METLTYTELNKETPIGKALVVLLAEFDAEKKIELLEGMTESEFIDHRVEVYFSELENARSRGLGESGAEEIARYAALDGLAWNIEKSGAEEVEDKLSKLREDKNK